MVVRYFLDDARREAGVRCNVSLSDLFNQLSFVGKIVACLKRYDCLDKKFVLVLRHNFVPSQSKPMKAKEVCNYIQSITKSPVHYVLSPFGGPAYWGVGALATGAIRYIDTDPNLIIMAPKKAMFEFINKNKVESQQPAEIILYNKRMEVSPEEMPPIKMEELNSAQLKVICRYRPIDYIKPVIGIVNYNKYKREISRLYAMTLAEYDAIAGISDVTCQLKKRKSPGKSEQPRKRRGVDSEELSLGEKRSHDTPGVYDQPRKLANRFFYSQVLNGVRDVPMESAQSEFYLCNPAFI